MSVVVPVHDAGALLGEALDAIEAQTFRSFEVVVVDDGSTDDSAAVAEAHGARVVRLAENQGPNAARNAGLAVARGELIALADADDLMLPHKLEAMVAWLDEHPEIGVLLARHELLVDQGGEGLAERYPRDAVFGDVGGVETFSGMVRRATFAAAGPFDAAMSGGGVEWQMRVRDAGVGIAVHPEPLYRKRAHAGNLSHDLAEQQHDLLQALRHRTAAHRRTL